MFIRGVGMALWVQLGVFEWQKPLTTKKSKNAALGRFCWLTFRMKGHRISAFNSPLGDT